MSWFATSRKVGADARRSGCPISAKYRWSTGRSIIWVRVNGVEGAPGQGRAALKSLGIRDYARHCETDVGQTPVFIGGARKFNTAPSDQKF